MGIALDYHQDKMPNVGTCEHKHRYIVLNETETKILIKVSKRLYFFVYKTTFDCTPIIQ